MNFSSSQHIQQQTIQPISESAYLTPNTTPGSSSAYNAIHEDEVEKREKDNNANAQNKQWDGQTTDKETVPEIFQLLKKYRFKDFFLLSLGKYESALNAIVKNNRKARGISQSLPVSAGHKQNDNFINQITEQYINSGWLLEGKPGQAYSGSL